jgi:hypothetical protein
VCATLQRRAIRKGRSKIHIAQTVKNPTIYEWIYHFTLFFRMRVMMYSICLLQGALED